MGCNQKRLVQKLESKELVEYVESEMDETPALRITEAQKGESTASLFCNADNYQDYIYDEEKTKELIRETGKGCQLEGFDFRGQGLQSATFQKANLRFAVFRDVNLYSVDFRRADLFLADLYGAELERANFIGSDLRKANLQNTNYMEAFFRTAKLEGASYSEYDSIEAYIRRFSGAGITGPNSRGMKKVEEKESL